MTFPASDNFLTLNLPPLKTPGNRITPTAKLFPGSFALASTVKYSD
jgi:hypothetical protein